MLDDEDIRRLAEAFKRKEGYMWPLSPGVEISDPPGVCFTFEPPPGGASYVGVPNFVVLRESGRLIPIGAHVIIVATQKVLKAVGAPLRPDSALQQSIETHWPAIVEEAVRGLLGGPRVPG